MSGVRRKIVVVGDGGCGKTSMLLVYAKGEFPSVYVPTVFENFITSVELDGASIELAVWDTAGQEEYDRLRPLSYPNTHILLLCYSMDSPGSLSNITAKWAPEVKHFCPGVPTMLIGCKIDLRGNAAVQKEMDDNHLGKMPTTEEGQKVAAEIQAIHHMECSALKGTGIKEVFELATRESLVSRKKKKSPCVIF